MHSLILSALNIAFLQLALAASLKTRDDTHLQNQQHSNERHFGPACGSQTGLVNVALLNNYDCQGGTGGNIIPPSGSSGTPYGAGGVPPFGNPRIPHSNPHASPSGQGGIIYAPGGIPSGPFNRYGPGVNPNPSGPDNAFGFRQGPNPFGNNPFGRGTGTGGCGIGNGISGGCDSGGSGGVYSPYPGGFSGDGSGGYGGTSYGAGGDAFANGGNFVGNGFGGSVGASGGGAASVFANSQSRQSQSSSASYNELHAKDAKKKSEDSSKSA